MTAVAAPVTVPQWAYDALEAKVGDEVRSSALPFMRSPDTVLGPSVLHAMSASRLSFAQTLVRRMAEHRWKITLHQCEIAEDSTGFLAYDIEAEELRISFGVYVYPPLPVDESGQPQMFRSMKREFLGILLDGPVDRERFDRERRQFDDRMWRGRSDPKVYGWTIASRGTRSFDQVVQALADGHQPDVARLDATGGYILRNGGYYGNGRMGTRAWTSYAGTDRALSTPYHVDLFSVYLWRLVSFDLAEATARARNPNSAALDPHIKRHLGIGNSSGLGTVAAVQRWPARFAAAVLAREMAFAYVKSRPGPVEAEQSRRLAELLSNAAVAYRNAPQADAALLEPRQHVCDALMHIRADAGRLAGQQPSLDAYPWNQLVDDAARYGSAEAVEVLHSLLLELYPEVDGFDQIVNMGSVRHHLLDPSMTIADLRSILETHFGWVLKLDLTSTGKREFFWYRSEENGENRRGERSVDIGVERETFIDVAGTARRLYDALCGLPDDSTVGRFLLEEPEHSVGVARAQLAADSPYSEIHASVCDADFLASNGIRAFLALLGIELPTPHSGRWVRGLFFRGAPLPEDLSHGVVGQWGIGAEAADRPHDGAANANAERAR